MPTHQVIRVTYNPKNAKVYTHQISENEVRLEIVGEDIEAAGLRLRPLNYDLTEVADTEAVEATL